jgi:hypothetical protein
MVLQSARGRVPSFAELVAGGPIRGSWWGHPKAHEIFRLASAVADSGEVLTCRLVDGKVTWVHRRLWPALVKLADRFPKGAIARVWSEHTPSGAHERRQTDYPAWVPADVLQEAEALSVAEAERQLAPLLGAIWPASGSGSPGARGGRRGRSR